MTTHEYYMHKALQEARQAAEEGEIPVGAVVVCKGKIIARAHNETEKLNDVTAHGRNGSGHHDGGLLSGR